MEFKKHYTIAEQSLYKHNNLLNTHNNKQKINTNTRKEPIVDTSQKQKHWRKIIGSVCLFLDPLKHNQINLVI